MSGARSYFASAAARLRGSSQPDRGSAWSRGGTPGSLQRITGCFLHISRSYFGSTRLKDLLSRIYGTQKGLLPRAPRDGPPSLDFLSLLFSLVGAL